MSDPNVRPQEHRVLQLTIDALRARHRLPQRDPLTMSAAWLRPNWPDVFVLASHQMINARRRRHETRSSAR